MGGDSGAAPTAAMGTPLPAAADAATNGDIRDVAKGGDAPSTFAQTPVPTLDVMVPFSAGFKIADPTADSTKMALFDSAFKPNGDLLNTFIDNDSRNFFFRVTDQTAAGKGKITIEWHTGLPDINNIALDSTADDHITLLEDSSLPGVFNSSKMIVVRDDFDMVIATPSGLPTGSTNHEPRVRGDSNFRIRRSNRFGSVQAIYKPAAGTPVTKNVPVFQLAERFDLDFNLFFINMTPGGPPVLSDSDINDVFFNSIMLAAGDIYETIGVRFHSVPASVGRKLDGGPFGQFTASIVDPPATLKNDLNNIDPDDMVTISNAFPPNPNKIRVFIVGGLKPGRDPTGKLRAIEGKSWPQGNVNFLNSLSDPSQHVPASIAGCVFFNSMFGAGIAMAHEIGHIVFDKALAASLDGKSRPVDPFADHFHSPGGTLTQDQDLMNPQRTKGGIKSNKRIWDAPDADGFNQFEELIRKNRFAFLKPSSI